MRPANSLKNISQIKLHYSITHSILIKSIILIINFLFISSCNDENPLVQVQPDPLKYEWVIDTLKNPYGYGVVPYAIWGSSDTNIWVAGFNTAWQGELFQYNGKKWERKTPNLGFNYSLETIYGFGPNDLYAAGSKTVYDSGEIKLVGLVLHYNGTSWQVENIPYGGAIRFIHGNHSSNIWAAGWEGEIYHKTVNQWSKMQFDKREYLGIRSVVPKLGPIYVSPSDEIFIMSNYWTPEAEDTTMHYFSKLIGNKWIDLDSSVLIHIDGIPRPFRFGDRAMWGNYDEIYSAGMGGVFKLTGEKWTLVSWSNRFFYDVRGASGSRIFAVGDHGLISCFEGQSWRTIYDFYKYQVDFMCVMPFQDKVFIGAFDNGRGFVIKGKSGGYQESRIRQNSLSDY